MYRRKEKVVMKIHSLGILGEQSYYNNFVSPSKNWDQNISQVKLKFKLYLAT